MKKTNSVVNDVTKINATFRLLYIYIYIYIDISLDDLIVTTMGGRI